MKIKVVGQTITIINTLLVSNSVGIYEADFSFSGWDGWDKTAVFKLENGEAYEVLLNDDKCIIPQEVLKKSGILKIGVYGTKDEKVMPTIWAKAMQVEVGTPTGAPCTEPTPSIYAQLLKEMHKISKDNVWEKGVGENSAQLKSTGCSAEGTNSVATGLNTVAASDYSHAEGYASKTSINPDDPDGYGSASHAEGTGTIAKGTSSHAEGGGSLAIGRDSHAEGNSTTTGADASHAEGNWTITNNFAEHAEGTFNLSNMASSTFGDAGNTLHSIGIGKATGELKDDRRNAVEVMQNGDVYIIGIGGFDGTNYEDAKTLQEVISELIPSE